MAYWGKEPVYQKWSGEFRNVPTEMCGPPPEVIANIPVRRNLNGPTENSGIFGIMESTPFDLLYVMLSGCDWWISIRSVNNAED